MYACLSLAFKVYGSYFSEFLYLEAEDQEREVAEMEVEILGSLGGVVVRTTSLDYFNLESRQEHDRTENINAWIDIILSGKDYKDLFVLSS